jgi:predicted metal-dependent peptidase
MSDETTLESTRRVMKARAELILSRTFYGVLVSQVSPVPSRKFPTMATNGKTHYFNPEFVAELTNNELLAVQAHETEHDARRHHARRGNRDRKEWNIATDLAINGDLIVQGFKLPEGALFDPQYAGMSAEDIYRTREILRAEEQRQRQAAQDQQDDDQDDQDDQDGGNGDQDDQDDQEGDQDDQDGSNDSGDDQDDQDDENNDQDGSDGDSDGNGDQDDDQDGGNGNETGDQEGDQEDSTGSGAIGDSPDESGEKSAQDTGKEKGDNDLPESSGDPGMCGEVLDAGETQAEKAQAESEWETIMRQAAALAAKRGEIPGHVARLVESADHPPQDWRETLRAFFDGGATTIETWSRPNRRFVGYGMYLPGRKRDGVNRAVFLIDTSGSVTYYPGALEAIKVETQAALDENIIDEAVIVYGDTSVTRVDTYHSGDEIEFDPRGGGGTYMRPLFDYARDEVEPSLIVAFTDLEIEPEAQLGNVPDCPVLWAVVGLPANVKRYLAATPWDAPGIEVRPDMM